MKVDLKADMMMYTALFDEQREEGSALEEPIEHNYMNSYGYLCMNLGNILQQEHH
jgi:hypothetical protein